MISVSISSVNVSLCAKKEIPKNRIKFIKHWHAINVELRVLMILGFECKTEVRNVQRTLRIQRKTVNTVNPDQDQVKTRR